MGRSRADIQAEYKRLEHARKRQVFLRDAALPNVRPIYQDEISYIDKRLQQLEGHLSDHKE